MEVLLWSGGCTQGGDLGCCFGGSPRSEAGEREVGNFPEVPKEILADKAYKVWNTPMQFKSPHMSWKVAVFLEQYVGSLPAALDVEFESTPDVCVRMQFCRQGQPRVEVTARQK